MVNRDDISMISLRYHYDISIIVLLYNDRLDDEKKQMIFYIKTFVV